MSITGESESDSLMQNNESCSLPCTPEEERQIIEELDRQFNRWIMKEGDVYYLVSNRWYIEWRKYTGLENDQPYANWITPTPPPPRPGQIDNRHLFIDGEGGDIQLVKDLLEGYDYVFVSEQVWKKFHEWYKGGPAIPRKVISQGTLHKTCIVDVYPHSLDVCQSRFGMDLVCAEPETSRERTQFSDFSTRYIKSFYWENTLDSSSDGEDGSKLSEMAMEDREGGGLAGLQNLGNTCFMNSALQCLMHTTPLVDYFLKDYSEEINKQNPIGMQGELAITFGDLLRELWSPSRIPIAPGVFKTTLARFAPQFSGYNQHDSHELLAFLLDGLHEDLNRIKVKPYIELKDANGRSDKDVGNEYWEIHKARNNSVIVDVCQGQYKSTLVCPVCKHVSVTFDPFMYLSLPLPSKATRSMTITVFRGDGSALPMLYTVTVLKCGLVKDLEQALSNACCLRSDEGLLLAEVYEHHIYKYYDSPFEPLAQIKDIDYIVAYRLPKNHGEYTMVEIVHRTRKRRIPIGTPLVTCLEEVPKSSEDVQYAINMVLKPLSTMDNMEVDQLLSYNLSFDEEEQNIEVCLDWSDREFDMYEIGYLRNLPRVYRADITGKKTQEEEIKLSACLETFLKEEPLGPDDMWYCPTCKEHKLATKKLDLWRLPEILVVHLKRFSYSRYLKNKLDTFVDFPLQNLDLKDYVKSDDADSQSSVYELYAVSNHYGGLGAGHYSAYAKLEEDKWYHFDDSSVCPVSEEEIKTSAAYVLFYRRVPEEASESSLTQSSSGSSTF